MKSIKILALDMDGTILNHYSSISSAVQMAIRGALAQGVKVLFSTGRTHMHMVPFFPMVDLHLTDTLQISNNGTTIATPQGKIHRSHQPIRADYVELIHRLEESGSAFTVATDLVAYRNNSFAANDYSYNLYKMHPDLKNLVNPSRIALQSSAAIVSAAVKGLAFEYANSIEDYFDIWPKGVDKGTALIEVARYYSVKMENVMAIGDSDNDLGMLRVAGLSLAMGQGSKDAKECAHFTIPSIDDDGVAWAINKYILNHVVKS